MPERGSKVKRIISKHKLRPDSFKRYRARLTGATSCLAVINLGDRCIPNVSASHCTRGGRVRSNLYRTSAEAVIILSVPGVLRIAGIGVPYARLSEKARA